MKFFSITMLFITTLLKIGVAQYNEDWLANKKSNMATFSKKDNEWLVNQGIDIVTYNWSNPDLNKHIKKAVGFRTANRITMYTSLTAGIISGYMLFASNYAEEQARKDKFKKSSNTFGIIAIASISLSIPFSIGAKNQVKKANQLK